MTLPAATLRQIINPAVSAAAALFTDGRITDRVLADVAAMERLPLHVSAVTLAPSAAEIADAALRNAAARHREAVRLYCFARVEQAAANRFPPRHYLRSAAFRLLNKRRVELARAERALTAAQAALAALTPPVLALAA